MHGTAQRTGASGAGEDVAGDGRGEMRGFRAAVEMAAFYRRTQGINREKY